MKYMASFLAINGAFVGANLVAVGIWQVLGAGLKANVPDAGTLVLPWVLIGIVAAWCAVIFMVGAVVSINSIIRMRGK